MKPSKSPALPKILFYDIETSPNLGYYYGRKYDARILGKLKHSDIFSFAYKWSGSKETFCHTQEKKNEKQLLHILYDLFQESDIIVAHYGDKFDLPTVRARMIHYRIQPPKILTTIDTKKVAAKYFKFDGNSLDDLAEYLGLPRKIKANMYDVWIACMKGDKSAYQELVTYNKRDVNVLEEVYETLLPWIENHPNIAKILNPEGDPSQRGHCPKCGSEKTQVKGYGRATATSIKRQWRCADCGKWFLTTIGRTG